MTRFWKAFGSLVVVALALAQLVQILGLFSYKIKVTAEIHELVHPPAWRQFVSRISDDYSLDERIVSELEARHKKYSDDDGDLELTEMEIRTIERAADVVADMVPEGMPGLAGWSQYENALLLKIENTGRKEATNVILRLTSLAELVITPSNGDPIRIAPYGGDRIELGNLLPGEQISVRAWNITSISKYDVQKMRVFHGSGGYTEPSLYEPVSPFWVGLSKSWVYIALMIVGIMPLLISTVLASRKKAPDVPSSDGGEGAEEDSAGTPS